MLIRQLATRFPHLFLTGMTRLMLGSSVSAHTPVLVVPDDGGVVFGYLSVGLNGVPLHLVKILLVLFQAEAVVMVLMEDFYEGVVVVAKSEDRAPVPSARARMRSR